MQINTLKLKTVRKRKKVIGRGGKKGTYSGRGVKGQKARSGGNIDPLFGGDRSALIRRMKKKRGFNSSHIKPVAIKFSDLAKRFENGAEITLEKLLKKNLLKKTEAKRGVKIVGPKKEGEKNFSFGTNFLFTKSTKPANKAIKK